MRYTSGVHTRHGWTIAILFAACVAGQTPAPTPPPVASQPAEPAPANVPDPEPPPATAPPESPPEEIKPIKLSAESLARARRVQRFVRKASKKYDVAPGLINGVIWVESKFNPRARGPAGARGLMQLMPRTSKGLAKKIGRRNKPYDPEFNIYAGTYYLSRLLKKFDGNESLALAGYSRGGGRVKGWVERGEPLPDGVQRFIKRVERARFTFEQVFSDDAKAVATTREARGL